MSRSISDRKILLAADLEEMTGADFMISPLEKPVVPAFLDQHIQAGCFLVQRKSGMDLASSIGERMADSLARMRATGARQSQCVLLFIGSLMCDKDYRAVIDGQVCSRLGDRESYWMVQGAISKWNERGGTYETISRPALFPGWLSLKERHMFEYQKDPVHTVMAEPDPLFETIPDDPMQALIPIKDWRLTLVTFRGLGPKRISTIYEHLKATLSYPPRLIDALRLISTWEMGRHVPGYTKGLCRDVREWLGMDPGTVITPVMDESQIQFDDEMNAPPAPKGQKGKSKEKQHG